MEGSTHESMARESMRLHRFEVCLNHGLVSPTGPILADEPGNREKLTVVFLDDISNEVPGRLGVEPMHPPRLKGLLQILKRRSWGVMSDLWVLHNSNHVLEAIVSGSTHLPIHRRLGGERPCDCEPHTSSLDALLPLCSEYTIHGRYRCLHSAPSSLRMALGQVSEPIWLVQKHEGGHCWVPRVALPESIPEASQRGFPEVVIAVEVWALPMDVGGLQVVPRHDVQGQVLRIVQKPPMVTLDVQTHRVVQPHIIGAQSGDHTQIVSPTCSPLLCVPNLHQVLPWTTASERLRAGHGAVSYTTHRSKRRQAARCQSRGDLCRCCSDNGAKPERITHRPTPSCCNRFSSIRCSPGQPGQVCAEAVHWPLGTGSETVTSQTGFSDHF